MGYNSQIFKYVVGGIRYIMVEELIRKESINEELSKEIVFEKLFNSYNYGNLGLFVGAGFSKAAMEGGDKPALNWLELIKATSERFEMDFPDSEKLVGVSLPELATNLCKDLALRKNINYEEAKCLFKNEICKLSNWLPCEDRIEMLRVIFDTISPAWIITTNYDLVLESVLTGKSKSLGPFNYLSSPRGSIPIYHIHGTRLEPDSIIITQDDYIPLFRPNEYRQSKLAMTIRESTTLVLGYSLGDMNVLSALDWSKNIYTQKNEYPYEIVQAVWTSNPNPDPNRDENGNIIIEINDLEQFLNELSEYLLKKEEEYKTKVGKLKQLIGLLEIDDPDLVKRFMTEQDFRIDLLKLVSKFEYHMIYSYIEFFIRCINKVWEETSADGAFYAYNKYLNILLDIIVNYEYSKMPPRLFQITAKALDRVLSYVGFNLGDSWGAKRSWDMKKNNIPKEMVNQLYNYSDARDIRNLESFMSELLEQ